ncbi:MAG: Multi-sensor hybrid histidine kinase [Thermotogales bacterium 46_20]|nr:MAG: Multi-sensor hybrid histidine kinase [Thermotogales bacterium 46_20]
MDKLIEILTENSSDYVVLLDSDGKILGVNPKVTESLGYEESDLLGKPVAFLYPESVFPRAEEVVREMLVGSERRCELLMINNRGKIHYVETRIHSYPGNK